MPSPRRDPVREAPAVSQTVDGAFRNLAEAFRHGGIASPELDARLLILAACKLSHEQFAAAPDRAVSRGEADRVDEFRIRRLQGEPVSRLVGVREFWGLPFALGPQTLDPRPDTETLVAAALELAPCVPAAAGRPSILDLGTGTGCVLIALLRELPRARGLGIDISPAAVAMARANADRLGVRSRTLFCCGSWTEALSDRFDLVVSNPPYVRTGEIPELAPEVACFDPVAALDGGEDGLDCYGQILPRLGAVMRPGGWVLLEIGAGQAEAVLAQLQQHGLGTKAGEWRLWRDLAGHSRCIAARASEGGG